MAEILFNESIKDYTLKDEINGIKSIKKIPIRFKLDDNTSRFRRDILKKEFFDN